MKVHEQRGSMRGLLERPWKAWHCNSKGSHTIISVCRLGEARIGDSLCLISGKEGAVHKAVERSDWKCGRLNITEVKVRKWPQEGHLRSLNLSFICKIGVTEHLLQWVMARSKWDNPPKTLSLIYHKLSVTVTVRHDLFKLKINYFNILLVLKKLQVKELFQNI